MFSLNHACYLYSVDAVSHSSRLWGAEDPPAIQVPGRPLRGQQPEAWPFAPRRSPGRWRGRGVWPWDTGFRTAEEQETTGASCLPAA